MDPHATWDELLCAYAEGDYERSEELAAALSEWLDKGGFPPTVLGNAQLGPAFEEALAKAGCDFILEAVHARWTTATGDGA